DFPYVHLMRRIDDTLAASGKARIFFKAPDKPFQDARDWGTLIHLVNADYEDLVAKRKHAPQGAARFLFERIDAAAKKAGVDARLGQADAALAKALEKEAADWLKEKDENIPESLSGKTLVIEFARGGPQNSSMPLIPPFGYAYSLAQLSPAILEKAAILYVWVTPEESRRKNEARTDPSDPGSILHHGVPLEVMLGDYGCDDMDWLENISGQPGAVCVKAHGKEFFLKVGRFDNRVDKTSFLRADAEDWDPAAVKAVHEGLKSALDRLV
ncbi:MAG: hypothetical protein KGL53_17220, partial [Elusimicrobia bacterium]|nr:hypothetical protein [Elusimicrobiota bacterium]